MLSRHDVILNKPMADRKISRSRLYRIAINFKYCFYIATADETGAQESNTANKHRRESSSVLPFAVRKCGYCHTIL